MAQAGIVALRYTPPAVLLERERTIHHVPEALVTAIDRRAYPFQSRWLELSVGRMHYVDEGQGPPVLFVHGTPTWSFEWRHVISGLRSAWRCIAPDLIGFGLSDRPRDFPYTPEAHAAALLEFVGRLEPGPLTLVVHDFGGPIGLPLCFRQPGLISRLVLVNTWMWSFADDRAIAGKARIAAGTFGRFLYRYANFSLRVLMPQAFGNRAALSRDVHRQYLDRFPDPWSRGTVLWALARALLGSSAYYESLWAQRERLGATPALILWGMKDPAFQPYLLDKWKQALPHARVIQLDAAGHWPHEETPERVVAEMRRFLEAPSEPV